MLFLALFLRLAPLILWASAAVIVGLIWLLIRQNNVLRESTRLRNLALDAEQAAIRILKLAAIELRAPAMTLLGHADRLTQSHPAEANGDLAIHSAAIAGGAMHILDLADELQDHAVGEPAGRILRLETVALEPLLRDAIVGIEASLGPSRRQWRLAPDIAAICLHADRRALTQIVTRVLGNAARLSRDRDWIDIRTAPTEGGLCLAIEDEGVGLPAGLDLTPGAVAHSASRGLGLGLALARVLMAAHGGALTVESATRVGSRVMLIFPPGSLVVGQQIAR